LSQNVYLDELAPFRCENGVLVQGLPGLGYVGKIAADFLVDYLKPVKLAELYSTYIALPDGDLGVRVEMDGTFQLPKYEFHGYERKNDQSLVILTGEIQPVAWGQYSVATRILEYADKLGCRSIVALGGHIAQGRRHDVVYAIGGDKEIAEQLQKHNVQIAQAGAVKGAFGVLLGLAKQRNTPCFGLLGATPGTHPDLVAARNVLRALAGIYELPIGLDEIDHKIQDMESRVKKLQQFQAEVLPGTETPTTPPVPRGYIS
jgi:uncharacterized protein (TIGR00162 family)